MRYRRGRRWKRRRRRSWKHFNKQAHQKSQRINELALCIDMGKEDKGDGGKYQGGGGEGSGGVTGGGGARGEIRIDLEA